MVPESRHVGDVARDPRDERIAELEALVAKLMARVAELEEKLSASSRNSSKPPSSDPPTVTREPKAPTGRKPGGQPGHKKNDRALLPAEKVTEFVPCIPEACEKCGGDLVGGPPDPEPVRHQVTELPKIEPIVTEYQLHHRCCGQCGHVTLGELPRGAPTGAFGPRVIATIALLLGAYRLSRRRAADAMSELFGVEMSTGAVVGCQKIATAALERPYDEALKASQQAAVRNIDETGWKLKGTYACLWTVVTDMLTVFHIATSRGRAVAEKLLGKTRGILGTDRYVVYDYWPNRQKQVCWAHLERAFVRFKERRGDVGRIGEQLLAQTKTLFEWWHRVRDGTLSRATLQTYVVPLRHRVLDLLEQGVNSDCSATAGTCAELVLEFDALWTFVRYEGVEPTNNAAERALRHPVIIRKVSFGSGSEHGLRFVERVLTAYATLRQQSRPVYDFFLRATQAYLARTRGPSLVRGA
jgi:transposase